MPDPRDFLPMPPWEGPPLPRYLVEQEPPTPRQLRYIAILCQKLGIKEPLEEQVKTRGEAGRLIRELAAEERYRKGLKGGNPKAPYWAEEYDLVRRTKRGSLVSIKRVGRRARLEITNPEDMKDITNLLNAAGIEWKMYRFEDFYKWWPGPPHLKPVWIIEFDFGELERVIKGLPLMLE